MGKTESHARGVRRKRYVKDAVLSVIGAAGIIAVAALAPNVFQILPHIIGKKRYKLAFQARTAVSRLIVKGHVRFVQRNGKKYIELTSAGRQALLLEQEKAKLTAHQPKRWDGRYRIVMFDIPQQRRATRDRIRRLMQECGFLRLQDSVWVYPYDCEEFIILAKAELQIGKDVLYVVVESIENDGWVRERFRLRKER